MQTRRLGKDLTVSAVGLGCMGFSHAYGAPTEEKEAVRMIRLAAEVCLTPTEVRVLDDALDSMEMSAVFGGTPVKKAV